MHDIKAVCCPQEGKDETKKKKSTLSKKKRKRKNRMQITEGIKRMEVKQKTVF